MVDEPVSLREFFQRQLDSIDRRLDDVNEKLTHLIQAEARFADSKINDAEHTVLETRINLLERNQASLTGKSTTNVAWIAAIIAILGMIAAFAALIWRK